MHKMIEYVCEELEALEKKAAKGSMSAAEIEYADKLANLKKNLLKSEILYDEMEGSGEYSGAGGYEGNMGGGSYARGGRGGSSNRGGSYARGGSRAGGSYARGRGSGARRDTMGRYSSERGGNRSYADGMEDMAETIREMMGDLPEEIQRDAERLVQKIEQQM